MVTLILYRSS